MYTAVVFLAACNKESIHGDGPVVSEERTVPSFTQVQLDGDGELTISHGTTQKVSVSGYQNLLPVYETKIVAGVLHLGFKPGYSIRNNNMRVVIQVPELTYMRINGSGKIIATNFIQGGMLAYVNGSGDLLLRDCKFTQVLYSVNGSGNLVANTSEANDADVEIHGSGKILLRVVSELDVYIAGSGTVDYWGNPMVVNSQVSGSGRINKKWSMNNTASCVGARFCVNVGFP